MTQSINASNYDYNDFSFSMQTSTGDKIALKLYDEKSSEVSLEQNENSTSISLSLTHSYGYSFNYEGNGIDANDKKEIKEAMKLIQPMLEQYFANVNESAEDFSMSEITNKAFDINSYLPKFENGHDNRNNDHSNRDHHKHGNNYDNAHDKHQNRDNNINYLNDKTLQTIDKILEKAENQNQKILEHAQKLFDKLLKQSDGFEFYM